MKQKTWFVDAAHIGHPPDFFALTDERFVPTYTARVKAFLDRQKPLATYINQEIWARRLRRTYRNIRFEPTTGDLTTPKIKRDLISTHLTVPVSAKFSDMLACRETDNALSDLFISIFKAGFRRIDDAVFLDCCESAIAKYRAAQYSAQLYAPFKGRIDGTDIMYQITYHATPTSKTCAVALWKERQPKQQFNMTFPLIAPKQDDTVISTAEYTPAQGAVLQGEEIRFGIQTGNGIAPHPDLIEHTVLLATLEDITGPTKHKPTPGRLRLV